MAMGRTPAWTAMMGVDIERIAAGGAGIGRLPNGKAVFVPRTAPGDRVRVAISREKNRWAEARPLAFDAYGPDRTQAQCVHYARDACGGCQIQHLEYAAQTAVKSRLIGDALRRIGKRDLPDPPVDPAPEPWRYRSKITMAAEPERGAIGLHRWDTPETLFEPDDCLITRESVMTLWRKIRHARDLLPADLDQLVLREDRDRRLHAMVISSSPWNAEPLAAHLADPTISLWWKPVRGAARVLAGPERGFPATAFEQSSPDLAGRIRLSAVEFVAPAPGASVWDLYGGVGDTARLLVERGAAVWSVDSDRRAHAWAKRVPVVEAGTVRFVTGRVEDVLNTLPSPRGIVLNPPRSGVTDGVAGSIDRLGREGTPRMAYISCDPATLARDLRRLPAWLVVDLRGFDLFPQTSHVETLALLEARR